MTDSSLEADLTVDDASGVVVGTVAAPDSRVFAIRMNRAETTHLWIELDQVGDGGEDDAIEVVSICL